MKNLYTFLFLISFFQIQAQTWHWINPTNGHHHLNDIAFITPGNGIAVADNGVILHYNDSIWTQAESTVSENLNAVYYLSPTLAWAVGNNGTILKFNGSGWVQQESPVTVTLNDVCFTDETHGWAVGNTILFYDGNTWQVQAEASGLKSVSFATPQEGWAAGSWGALKHYLNGEWVNDNSLNVYDFTGICMTSQNTARLIGNTMENDGVFFENTGSGWQSQNSGSVNAGISFTDHQNGFGLFKTGPPLYGPYPSVYRYYNGDWIKEFSAGMMNTLNSVEAISSSEAFVSDNVGFIYHGLEGNWNVSNGFTADSILDIDFTRANNGYFACGSDGIWHYEAGKWTNELKVEGFSFNEVTTTGDQEVWASACRKLELPAPYNYEVKLFSCFNGIWIEETIQGVDVYMPVSDIDIASYDIGISSYNILYTRTQDAWTSLVLPFSDSITSFKFMQDIPIADRGTDPGYIEVAAWMCIKRSESDVKGVIYYNDFSQEEWTVSYETTNGGFNDLSVSGNYERYVYAVGDNGLIAYFDGGTWSEFEPVTSEDLLSVCIYNNNEGWACGRNGTLLKYNGMGWSVVQSNTMNDLFRVTIAETMVDLVGGKNGTLLCTQPELPVGNSYSTIDNTKDVLTIFPNPAQDNALVQFDANEVTPAELRITDMTGRLVFEQSITLTGAGIQTIPVKLQNLRNGIYLLKVISGGQILTGKILKQK
ncbi:MAG: T9SS type A sorting domain-containing protein [Lentimicrobium sp.]